MINWIGDGDFVRALFVVGVNSGGFLVGSKLPFDFSEGRTEGNELVLCPRKMFQVGPLRPTNGFLVWDDLEIHVAGFGAQQPPTAFYDDELTLDPNALGFLFICPLKRNLIDA